MKKLFKLLLSAALCIALVLPTFAVCFAAESDNAITLTPKLDAVSNELLISGSIASARGNVPLIMTVKSAGGELVSYLETVSGSSTDGACTFNFEGVPFPADAVSADYTVYVSADFVKASKTITYGYSGIDSKHGALEDIAAADTTAEMIAAIDAYPEILGLTSEEAAALTSSEKTIIAEMLLEVDYDCPADYSSDANIATITNEIAKAAEIVKEATVIIEAGKFETSADVEAWLAQYADAYGFYDDNANTEYDDAKAAKYFDEATMTSNLISDIAAKAQKARSVDELIQIMHSEAALELIAASNNYKVKEIAEAIPKMFGINTSKFSKLSDSQKTKVYGVVSGVAYDTASDFGKAVNDKTNTYLDDDGGDGGGGGYTGGGSVSSSPLGGKLQPGADAADAETTGSSVYVNFVDLEDYEWARESIEALYRRGIVNGKDDTHFAPGDLVTRAELSKMVVEALGLELSGNDSGFSDVAADSWYAPYVTTARENGIVEGDGTNFNPDGAITREDIATILFRAMEIEASGDKTIFTDYDSISDYAKDAVIGLYEAGVVNGTGNGAFEPKKNATRAEAAKMIYLALCQD